MMFSVYTIVHLCQIIFNELSLRNTKYVIVGDKLDTVLSVFSIKFDF